MKVKQTKNKIIFELEWKKYELKKIPKFWNGK